MRTQLLQTSSELMALGLNATAFGVACYLPARYFGPMIFPRRAARVQQRQASTVAQQAAEQPGIAAGTGVPAGAIAGTAAATGALGSGYHGWRGSAAALLRLGTRGRGGGGAGNW